MWLLKPIWEKAADRFWVSFDKEDANSLLKGERVYHCHYPTNRNIPNLLKNTVLAWKVLRKERPDLIISSGAAVAVPFFLIGKMLGSKCVYVEVFDRVDKPTMTGRMLNGVADLLMREFDRDVREKLIWKVYPFKPCPSALAKEILMGDCRPSEDLDMHSAILAGVEASGCVNARAMIRAHELIRRICSLEVLQNTGIALQNRFYALRDAVHFALLTSMGNVPSMPQNGKPEEWLSPEALEYDRRVSLYEQYSDFSVIGKAFDPSGDVDIEDLEQGFKTYIWKRYPSNRDTLEVREIAKSMRCAYDLDDDNVDGLAQRYYDLVTRAHYSVDCLHDVLEVYYLLSDLKWECPFSQNDFIKYCKKVIDADLDKASELLSGPVFSADERRKRRALAEELERYARTELNKKMSSQLMISEGAEGLTGREIARLLNDAAERDVKVLVNASPRVIVESFCREDAANQEALRKFFVHLHNVWIPGGVPSADLVEWILEIKTALEETNVETKTGSMRRRLFLRNLEELESRFGYPVQK